MVKGLIAKKQSFKGLGGPAGIFFFFPNKCATYLNYVSPLDDPSKSKWVDFIVPGNEKENIMKQLNIRQVRFRD